MDAVITWQIADNLYLIRTIDRKLKYFEALWEVPEGMVYNSYLLKTSEGAVLFDTTKANYTGPFLEALRSLIDPKEIKHLIVHHMEPDHSGAMAAVLGAIGEHVQVWGHPFAERLIQSLYGLDTNFQTVKNDTVLEIGDRKLTFRQMPWLHWPECMITYMPEEGFFFGGDIFGSYGIPEGVFDDDGDDLHEFLHLAREYFASVIGHYKSYVSKNFLKLEGEAAAPKMVLPAHGLLWRKNPSQIMDAYTNWANGTPVKGKVVVIYSSMYGFVEKSVQVVIDDLIKRGFHPKVLRFTDEHRDDLVDILGEIPDSEAVILATATYEAGIFPIMAYIIDEILHKVAYEKPLLLLSAFGWGGMVSKQLKPKLEESSFQLVDAIEIKSLLDDKGRESILAGVSKLVDAVHQP
jgi:flavorubredoxin